MFQNLLSNVLTMVTPANRYTINEHTVVEDHLISEGGYAYVYQVFDGVNPKQKYALKKIILGDSNALKATKTEVRIWKKLGAHPNIVKFVSGQPVQNKTGEKLMLILCELCEGGTLINVAERNNNKLSEKHIIQIMIDVVKGVKYMHSKGFTHRDLKVENILYQNGKYKLADFGSASDQQFDYKTSSKLEISQAMEQFEKYTTLMYRPPEMIDQYLQYKVDTRADLWMLGCMLYTLCFAKPPFMDAQPLAVINADYRMPNGHSHISDKLKDIIRVLLMPNPDNRPTIDQLEQYLEQFDNIEIKLPEEAQEVKLRHEQANSKGKKVISINKKEANKSSQNWSGFPQTEEVKASGETWDQPWDEHQKEQQQLQEQKQQQQQKKQLQKKQQAIKAEQLAKSQQIESQKKPVLQKKASNNPFDNPDFVELDQENNKGTENNNIDSSNGGQKIHNEFYFSSDDNQTEDEKNNGDSNNDWAKWDPNGSTQQEKTKDSGSEDEEALNMYDQIHNLKNKTKSWCSAFSMQERGEMKSNICTRTSDIISKFKEFLQKTE